MPPPTGGEVNAEPGDRVDLSRFTGGLCAKEEKMFHKLFVFAIVLVLVIGFVMVLDAVFYSPDASESAGGEELPVPESAEEAVVEAFAPLAYGMPVVRAG